MMMMMMYCNRKTGLVVSVLSRAYLNRYIDICKSLGIRNCSYEILRTDWTDDSFAPQDDVDNMTIETYQQMTSAFSYVFNPLAS